MPMTLGLKGLTLTGAASGQGGASSVTFGALALAGADGRALPSGATSITNAGGTNLTVSGGEVVPDTGGGVSSGTVTFDNGAEWAINAVANKYSTKADVAEIAAAWADAATATATGILISDGNAQSSARISLAAKAFTSEFTIEPHDWTENSDPRSTVRNVLLPGVTMAAGCQNVRLQGINFYETLGTDTEGAAGVIFVNAPSTNITIRQNEIHSRNFKDAYDNDVFSGSAGFVAHASQTDLFDDLDALRGVFLEDNASTHTRIRVNENYIHDTTRCVFARALHDDGSGNNSQINNNYMLNTYSNFTTLGGDSDGWEIIDNVMMHAWGAGDDVPSNPPHAAVGLSFDPGGSAGVLVTNGAVRGNLAHVGWERNKYTLDNSGTPATNAATGMKFNDPQLDGSNSFSYSNIDIAHNLIVSAGLCIELSGADNCDVRFNTLAHDDYTASGSAPVIYMNGASNCRTWNNLTGFMQIGSNDGSGFYSTTLDTLEGYGNIYVGESSEDFGWDSMFEGISGSFDFLTPDQLATAYVPVSTAYALTASEKKGALGTGYYVDGVDTAPAFDQPAASGGSDYPADVTTWDGSTYLGSGSALSNITNGDAITMAWEGEIHSDLDSTQFYFMGASGSKVTVRKLATGLIRFRLENSANAVIMEATTRRSFDSTDGYFHWAFSADLSAGRANFAVDGVPNQLLMNFSTLADDDADFTGAADWHLHSQQSGTDIFKGDFGQFLLMDEFVDLETDSGLGQLFASTGEFVDWGSDGTNISAGAKPVVIRGNAAAINGGTSNGGDGGAFTVTGGTVTDKSAGFAVDEGSSGGTFTTSGGFRVWTAANNDNLVVTTGGTPTGIEFVAGGAGGGGRSGGGGGAGELVQDNSTPPTFTVQTYQATVGAGGSGGDTGGVNATNGGDTELVGQTTDDITLIALGGGAGGTQGGTGPGSDGGSGGGGAGQATTGAGSSTASDGVGNDGGSSGTGLGGGGGGGANTAGTTATTSAGAAGGAGIASIAPGVSDTLASGGSGGSTSGSSGANGSNNGDGGQGGSGTFGSRDGGDGASGVIRVWWPV